MGLTWIACPAARALSAGVNSPSAFRPGRAAAGWAVVVVGYQHLSGDSWACDCLEKVALAGPPGWDAMWNWKEWAGKSRREGECPRGILQM